MCATAHSRSLQRPPRPRPVNFVVLPASRHPFGVGQHGIERRAVQVSAIRHHGGDAPGIADVGKRIAVDQNEVRQPSPSRPIRTRWSSQNSEPG